jgi:hypothetical protein
LLISQPEQVRDVPPWGDSESNLTDSVQSVIGFRP